MGKRLSKGAMKALFHHYSGNCFSCERCSYYTAIENGEPGAAEDYARYMLETHGVKVDLVDDGA